MKALVRGLVKVAVAVGVAYIALSFSCDALSSKTMAVGVLTKTPKIDSTVVDQRLLDMMTDLSVQEITAVAAFVGERPSATDTSTPPTGISGASVRVSWIGKTVTIPEVTGTTIPGSYLAYSVDVTPGSVPEDDLYVQRDLSYVENGTYTMFIDVLGDYYDLTIDAPTPIATTDVTFTDPFGAETVTIPNETAMTLKTHAKGAGLTVAWTTPQPQQAFLTLARLDFTGTWTPVDIFNQSKWVLPDDHGTGTNPIYDTFPRSVEDFIKLVTDSPVTTVTLEGSLFNQAGIYLLALTAVNLNTETTGLSLGSGGVGGVATPFVFVVKP
jgi:hypothetical protein